MGLYDFSIKNILESSFFSFCREILFFSIHKTKHLVCLEFSVLESILANVEGLIFKIFSPVSPNHGGASLDTVLPTYFTTPIVHAYVVMLPDAAPSFTYNEKACMNPQ